METGIEKAVRLAGNQTALAILVGVTPQAIQKWVAQGKPSPGACKQIEICLHGQVTRYELDPDLFGPITVDPTATDIESALRLRNGGLRTHGDAHDVEKLQ